MKTRTYKVEITAKVDAAHYVKAANDDQALEMAKKLFYDAKIKSTYCLILRERVFEDSDEVD
jgi:hypothetical protein